MSEWLVRSALVKSVIQAGIGAQAVFEEREAEPPADGAMYYTVFIVPADRRPITLGNGGEDSCTGFMQIDINAERGEGVRAIYEAGSNLTHYYTAGKRFVHNNQEVIIRRSQLGRISPDGARAVAPVTVFWEARIRRDGSLP